MPLWLFFSFFDYCQELHKKNTNELEISCGFYVKGYLYICTIHIGNFFTNCVKFIWIYYYFGSLFIFTAAMLSLDKKGMLLFGILCFLENVYRLAW